MNTLACPECGAPLAEDASRCDECGAPVRGRKRGELSGVRIDHDRLDVFLPPKEVERIPGKWGDAHDHPAHALERPHFAERPAERELERTTPTEALSTASLSTEAWLKAHAEHAELAGNGTGDDVPAQRASAAAVTLAEAVALRAHDAHEHHPSRARETPPLTAASTHALPLDAEVVVLVNSETGAAEGALPMAVAHPPGPPRRPPVLASEALLRDMAPAEPAPRALRIWSITLGAAGATAAWLLTQGHGIGVALLGTFVALALLGLPPMPYATRAFAVVTVAATGLLLLLWTDAGSASGLESALSVITVTLLATGLFLRAWHRASRVARTLVALGVCVGAVFFRTSHSFRDLTMIDTSWQSWMPWLSALPLGLLLTLSLLAFMDSRSTAGAAIWASCVLIWQVMHALLDVLLVTWPRDALAPNIALMPESALVAWLTGPLLTTLLALGLAQMLAAAMARAGSARAAARSSQWP